ncbi:MAG: helix-turn-helix domain-containing protein, partial [Aquificota bacterium]
ADMIGSSRETVSSLINKMKKENKIRTERKFIFVKKDLIE